ncbi:unnamed protein product [Cuscuta campestris]|uniref:K Homology domain-containing protein n=1 Tax=Cuscuta campestris TaxID=132261 RepID=A0A484NTU0_9ASTE|nr:unnamed protein product [Cuscuta campestris]
MVSPATASQIEGAPPQSDLSNVEKQTQSAADAASRPPESADKNGGAVAEQQAASAASAAIPKWPGWPGDNVFRLVVPVLKVGSIIGRKGEFVKKMCEESRARIRILEAPIGNPDRIVLITAREDPDLPLSPAMDGTLRVFKRVSGLSPTEEGGADSAAAMTAFSSIKLLVAASQAAHLIGKQGSTIKSIQENFGASVRVLPEDESPAFAAPDERIVDIHGEAQKVLKALEAILGQLRKFLVDHTVLPIFEKPQESTVPQDRPSEPWMEMPRAPYLPNSVPSRPTQSLSEYSLPMKRDPYSLDLDTSLDAKLQRSSVSLFGQDPALHGLPSSVSLRTAPVVTQMTKIMQVPLSYAEDIIGISGTNIAHIRRTSGAILSIQESRGSPDEITIEIKGASPQVQTAEQLIQEFINKRKEPASSIYGTTDTGLSSFSRYGEYPSSSSYQSQQPLGGAGVVYESSSLGGYGGYRY